MGKFLDNKLASLQAYVPGEQPKGFSRLIKLNTNESPFPPSPKAVEAVNRAQVEDLRLYPDPDCGGLECALAERYSLSPKNVVTGNGSDELLALIFHGFCENGACFPDITYGFYPVYTRMFGVREAIIPLREDFSIDVSDYEGQQGTVFIANPNAPTGLCLSLDKIDALLAQDPDRLVVVDEAYIDFGGETALPLLEDRNNLLVVRTFSKSRQLAGGRLAFAMGDEDTVRDLTTLKFSFNPYSVNRLALVAGEAAVRDDEYFQSCRRAIVKNRGFTSSALKTMGFKLTDSLANFIFASPPGISAEDYYLELRKRGVLVRYFNSPRIQDWVRITIGSREQMEALLEATADILKVRL